MANPTIFPPNTDDQWNFEIDYQLEVTDEYGCSVVSTPVIAEGYYVGGSSPTEAGIDTKICLDSEIEIGNNQAQPYFAYEWTSNNPLFTEVSTPNATLSPSDNSVPGVYTYTVERKLVDSNTGTSTVSYTHLTLPTTPYV